MEFTEAQIVAALGGGAALDAFIERKFGGEVFSCRFCGASIMWSGMCESCEARRETAQQTTEGKLGLLGVPEGMHSCSWDNFETPKSSRVLRVVEEVKRWRGRPPLLALSGPPGTGKTHMAVAVLRQRISEKGSGGILWLTDSEIVVRIKDGMGRGEEPIEEHLARVRLLVIDDLGQSHQSQWSVDTIMPILCSRIDNLKPTIITTNLTHEDIRLMDARFASRLHGGLTLSTRDLTDHRSLDAA